MGVGMGYVRMGYVAQDMHYVITEYVGMNNWHGNVGTGYVGMRHVSTGYIST